MRKRIPIIIGLINMLVKAHQPIVVLINGISVPAFTGCYMAYDLNDCEINENIVVFDLVDRVQDMLSISVSSIESIQIKERIETNDTYA